MRFEGVDLENGQSGVKQGSQGLVSSQDTPASKNANTATISDPICLNSGSYDT